MTTPDKENMDINTVIQGDCLEVMKDIPDGSIDAVITDPPYGTTACKWDTIIPFEPMWEQLKRITKKNGAIVLFGSQPFTSALVMSNPKMFKYEWVWEKSRAVGFPNAKNKPMNKHEIISVFSEGDCANRCRNRMEYNTQSLVEVNKTVNGIKECSADKLGHRFARPSHKKERVQQYTNFPNTILKLNNDGNTVHPTQKPVALMEYLVKTYTNEGETVLDFAAGSGTIGVACLNTNRNFILIEKDEHYCDIIRKRLSKVQGRLNDGFGKEVS